MVLHLSMKPAVKCTHASSLSVPGCFLLRRCCHSQLLLSKVAPDPSFRPRNGTCKVKAWEEGEEEEDPLREGRNPLRNAL